MHPEAYNYVERSLRTLPPRTNVVEIGSRNLNGTVRPLFRTAQYVGVDVRKGTGVDVVADGATYTPDTAPDTVVCCETLEHAENAEQVVRNAYEMLAPGGVLILTVATEGRVPHSGIDGNRLPEDSDEFYANISEDTLRKWLKPFGDVSVEVHEARGDLYATATKDAEPVDGYDDLTVDEVLERLETMDDKMRVRVRDYERKHKARKGVLSELETK